MRHTKEEVKGMFERLCKALRKSTLNGKYINYELFYSLDYNPIYGGYVIVKTNEDTSESHPFGGVRRSAKEMYLSMLMTAQALEDCSFQRGEK